MDLLTLESLFRSVARPTRYLGNEVNAVHKDFDRAEVKFLLAFPDLYDVGMSHLGFQLLYHLLNSRDDVAAERVFAPWLDMEKALREHALPLVSLESRRPLRAFDLIGFSLQYELSYTNVLTMLDLGHIPLRAAARDESFPLIIAGGPCTFNPEPMADFFDAMVIGEGEEVVGELIELYKEWRHNARSRASLLDALTSVSGVYVPSRFRVIYLPSGQVQAIEPLQPGYDRIKKRTVADLDALPYPTRFIVPFAPIAHDRINLEVARGCSRGCRFCQAGMIYRPVRERSRATLEQLAESAFAHTGWEEMSFLSLSTGDYSHIEDLLAHIIPRFSHHQVAVSLPSLRAETLTSTLIQTISQARKTGFTIAPEAGSERLRAVINKGLTERDILETCRQVFLGGWSGIKLYFMIGLPTETLEDLEAIVRLVEKVWAQGKGTKQKRHVNISVSTFVPKPHTPFQWHPMIGLEEIRFRQQHLRALLRGNRFNFKWQDSQTSILEGVLARGDRRISLLIEDAFRHGARFDGWSECFDSTLWESASSTTGLDTSWYLRARDESEVLPWDHIETGIQREFLLSERRNAEQSVLTPDCRSGLCHQCGICDHKTLYPRTAPALEPRCALPEPVSLPVSAQTFKRFRLCFTKREQSALLGHLEMTKAFARAARRAKLPLRYTQGYHPLPRMAFGPALPLGVESLAEHVDLDIVGDLAPVTLAEALNCELPEGLSILAAEEISLKSPAISDSITEVSYCLSWSSQTGSTVQTPEAIAKTIREFLSGHFFPYTRVRKDKVETLDLRPMVKEISYSSAPSRVELRLLFPQAQSIRPAELLKAVTALKDEELAGLQIIKTNTVLKV